jgi:AbrB family looped-hinge helix DNA binding protein
VGRDLSAGVVDAFRRHHQRLDDRGHRRCDLEAQPATGVNVSSWTSAGDLDSKAFLPYIQDEPKSETAMSTLTVTAKGQVTLRKDLLEHLGVHPGDKIAVEKLPDGRIEVRAAPPTGKISDLFGILKNKKKGRSLSIEEMNEVIARGWAGKR